MVGYCPDVPPIQSSTSHACMPGCACEYIYVHETLALSVL